MPNSRIWTPPSTRRFDGDSNDLGAVVSALAGAVHDADQRNAHTLEVERVRRLKMGVRR